MSENTIEHGMLETLASKQRLSDGVLDRLGDMKKVSLRGGRQVFLSKLEQMVSRKPEKKSPEPRHDVAPADRPLAFSEALQGKINGALVSCEERFPAEGEHSVVLVVVEELGRYQATIQDLHEEWFGGRLPEEEKTRLEVIDRGTAEALRRLESAGLYAPTFRASRALYPTPDTTHATPPPLSKEEQRRVQECLGKAQRNLDMAKLLGNGGFESETRRPLIEAIHDLGMAMAIEHRFQEPADANQSLRPPIARFWAGRLEVLRGFVDSDQTAWRPITEALEPVCDSLAQSHSTTTTR